MKFQDFIREVMRTRYLIYYLTAGFGIIFLIYALIIPRTYKAEGQVLPQMDVGGIADLSGMLGAMGGSDSKMLRIAKAAGLSLGYSSADVLGALLTSRTVMESVIKDCDLHRIYRIKASNVEKALKLLKSLTKIEITKEDMVRIWCLGKTPDLAARIVNSYINNLDLFLKEKSMTKGHNMRLFIEKRLTDAENTMEIAADSLKLYQEQNRVIVPDEEIKAALEAYAILKSQLFIKDIQNDVASKFYNPDAPYSSGLRIEVEATRKKLLEIESQGIRKEGFGAGFGVSFAQIPKMLQEYYRKYLEVKVQEEIYGFLMQQFEQARIMEVKDTPVITVLDWGKPPERKYSPKILSLFIIGLVLGLGLGLFECVITLFWNKWLQNRERRELVLEIKQAINGDLRKLLNIFGIRLEKKHS